MDRLIATNSVNLAGADGPPGAGTPQYATDGNPALNIPATRWPAYAFNAIQEELISVILASGIALDRASTTQLLQAIQRLGRIKLTVDTTFYVATTGSNANSGLVIGSPWLTVTYAYAYLLAKYDLNGFTATIQVADGVYAGVQTLSGPLLGQSDPGTLRIRGNSVTPANVTMALLVTQGAMATPQYMKFANAAGDGLAASFGGRIITGAGLVFGTCTSGDHIDAYRGGNITRGADYSIVGGANYHIEASQSGVILANGLTVTLTGTPAFAIGFVHAAQASAITDFTGTYTGAATGVRYSATENGVISTNGGGASYFPGNSSGVTATGGQYS